MGLEGVRSSPRRQTAGLKPNLGRRGITVVFRITYVKRLQGVWYILSTVQVLVLIILTSCFWGWWSLNDVSGWELTGTFPQGSISPPTVSPGHRQFFILRMWPEKGGSGKMTWFLFSGLGGGHLFCLLNMTRFCASLSQALRLFWPERPLQLPSKCWAAHLSSGPSLAHRSHNLLINSLILPESLQELYDV